MRILAISGSLRAGSYNTALLRAAAEVAAPGTEVALYAGLALVPPYDEDADAGTPPLPVGALRAAFANADALLVATPEYNGSIPGQLKNALDWASRPYGDSALSGKPVAVVSASTGSFGGVQAQQDLRRVLGVAGARVVHGDGALAVPRAHEHIAEDGRLRAPWARERLREILAALLAEGAVSVAA